MNRRERVWTWVAACGFASGIARLRAKPQAVTLLISLICTSSGLARDDAPPVAGRPEDFSGMVGTYRIATSAKPTDVHVEDPITLVVKITGDGPPEHLPVRKNLRLFPAIMNEDFFIEPLPEQDRRLQKENAWEFVYRLRPKHERVAVIPGLKLVYYHPGRGKFLTTYASVIDVKVTPRPEVKPPSEVVDAVSAPPSFFDLAPVAAEPSSWRLDQPIMLVALLVPPLLAIAWRWRARGNGTRTEQLRRSQAARQALQSLEKMHGHAGGQAFPVINHYLHQRFDLPMVEPVPGEVERCLARAGVSKPLRHRLVEFCQACDAARFANNAPLANGRLASEAAQLIQALEAEPCLR